MPYEALNNLGLESSASEGEALPGEGQ